MANQVEESTPASHTPQVVGNAFVEQYYNVLSQSPELLHRFYQNSSKIARPDVDGLMATASTLEGIEKMILSLDFKNCGVQILTTDAQESSGDGVIVLVTGFFTGKDDARRKFTQCFFLTPQDSRTYFVLNDVFRYVDEEEATPIKINDNDDTAPAAPLTPDPEPTLVSENIVVDRSIDPLEVEVVQAEESTHPLDNGKITSLDKEEVSSLPVKTSSNEDILVSDGTAQADVLPAPDATIASDVQDDPPKKSYASVANALNYKKQPFQQRILPPKPVEQLRKTVVVAPEAPPRPASIKSVEKNNSPVIVKGHAIFVANLPMNATVEQLTETFEKFGPIRPNGVQVRSYKQEKNCFGFVEFETAAAVQSALEVVSIKIGDRTAHIEEKKANNEGGKFPPRKGGFRGDNFRSRGNLGGRGFGRNDFDGVSGQSPRGSGRRNGDGNPKVYQNGAGRGARQGQGQALARVESEAEGAKS
ncbi:Nuclear transport factor 2 (NTF2) family protein with RNA binding (RRM-RBD-RNP motifs) domain [Euphorbia peplus]|nr:Nuclear transport factor 2 (NTF2) family protein with RNA binding (RRM-RBD-RNP motifs) domain [Euphorbia peplus]